MRTKEQVKAALCDPHSTHYQVLGISPGEAGDEGVLKAARRELALAFHPDRNGEQSAHDFTARANDAYRILSDGVARRRYDIELRSTHAPCPPCEGAGFKLVQRGFKDTKKLKCLGCAGDGWLRKSPRRFK